MPRQARKKSESQIYHVMLRGINQQQIFEESEDFWKFIKIIEECKAVCTFQLYAYCIMGNHVHLLIHEENESLEQIIKRIGIRYVHWYNIKYKRVGHLFQDRFKSEPVDSNEYFLTVLRYIHQNPIQSRLCKKCEDYPYSSYREYLGEAWLVDTDYTFQQLDKNSLVAFHHSITSESCLDIETTPKLAVTDEQAKKIIQKISKCQTISEFQKLDRKTRDKYLTKLREKGLSIRQISRLTGISFNIVRKA